MEFLKIWLGISAAIFVFFMLVPLGMLALWFMGAFLYSVADHGFALYKFCDTVQHAATNIEVAGFVLIPVSLLFGLFAFFKQ